MRRLLISLLALVSSISLHAQRVGVGYYDLDGLYDTIPAPFYNDQDYTPNGRYNWNSERYARKIRNIAAVIDAMALPIVGLYGVENRDVVRDIVRECSEDYSHIHQTSNSLDGLDFALLYFGDMLFIEEVELQRSMLIIEATLYDGEPISIILSRSGEETIEYLRETPREELVVVLGKLYRDEITKMGYTNALHRDELLGRGNYYYSNRGYVMHDRVAINQEQKILKSGVFITPWLLSPDALAPLPTFNNSHYIGGYSKYLPIFIYLY